MQNPQMKPGTTYPAIVGGVLTQIRNQRNLRQEELAQAVGVTQAWSRIEKGQSSITVEHLRLVANKIGIAPGQLLSFADQTETNLRNSGAQVMQARDNKDRDTAIAVIASVTLLAIIAVVIMQAQKS